MRERVEQIRLLGGLRLGDAAIASAEVLPAFYEQRDFRTAWTAPALTDQLVAAIRSAYEDGLDPADYHLAAIERMQRELAEASSPSVDVQASFDLLQTDALIRLAYHLAFGKVDPERLDPDWKFDRDFGDLEPAQSLAEALGSGDIAGLLAQARPQHPLYSQLRSALARYRAIAAQGGWPSVPDGPKLEKGMRGERVVALRKRLAASGEGPAGTPAVPNQFDEPLAQAVRGFQRRHGIPADGVVGASTLEALNVPVSDRIDQIRVNLERARWVLHEVKGDFLVVDIAAFNAAYIRNGETVWRSRVQVGTPYRKTPSFKSAITYLVFNPTWTVPPTILKKDILPAMQQGGNEIEKRGLKVLDRDGHPVDPGSVEWSRYRAANFPYLLRQDSGPRNALGRIKFMFPNQHSVYLHDTPKKSLFDKPERAFSSGCIRIEHPIDLAELLLDSAPRWDRDRILAAIDSKTTRTVFLARPVPILLLYWTVDFDEAGHVGFKKDIYERDRAVLEGLGQESRFRARPAV